MKAMYQQIFHYHVILSVIVSSLSILDATSISFATFGRSSYDFDIYALPLPLPQTKPTETRLSDGKSVNYNGHFPTVPSPQLTLLPPTHNHSTPKSHIIYVTERNGSPTIYLDTLYQTHVTKPRTLLETPSTESTRASTESTRVQLRLLNDESDSRVSMKDRPSLVGSSLIYVSTHENPGKPRTSWAAVYSTQLKTGSTRRLTPKGVSDFSPAVSPSGVWTAVASLGEKGWQGEIQELDTDVYVFSTKDGSKRVKVVEHGGWPSWGDDSSFYFHRKCDDGWWSVFKASLVVEASQLSTDSVVTQRVTPPGLHAFTPAASVANKSFIAVATRRPGSDFRHIELYDVVLNKFVELTRRVSQNVHHYNPFVSQDGTLVGYHKCRGSTSDGKGNNLVLENVKSPLSNISLFRIDGTFPSYSPDGSRIVYVKSPGLYVMNSDGSGVRNVLTRSAFSTAWDWKRKGIVYTSVGPTFESEGTEVDIISIDVDNPNLSYKTLTTNGQNNAFPSASPDGKWVVFRSGLTGHKNLYVMDALEGEAGGLHRLTEGPWTDTMGNWSPDGEWIVFASDRENPGSGSFAMFKIHPNGTGLQKVIQSGSGGRTNHPWFSPDSKHIVFTSDYAAVSAEPIANPHHYQPYGDIFVIKADGSGIKRLTHNSYEDGTPAWSPKFVWPTDAKWPTPRSQCSFDDCHWLTIRAAGDSNSSKRRCPM